MPKAHEYYISEFLAHYIVNAGMGELTEDDAEALKKLDDKYPDGWNLTIDAPADAPEAPGFYKCELSGKYANCAVVTVTPL